ncbi:MAG: outer membrane protein assembly factor, partial [Pseudomonadota bacterium]
MSLRPCVRLPLATALALLALSGQAAPASAFEILGFRLFGGDDTPPSPDAIEYQTDVSVVGDDRALRKKLSGASRLVADDGDPSPSPAALLATARGDYQRLLSVLYSEGHYGGTISITVDGREAANMPIDATVPDGAVVDLTIDPG